MKTLEQIKKEVAIEYGYKEWESIGAMGVSDWHVNKVANRYAQQFQVPTDTLVTEICVMQERIAELEDVIREIATQLELKVGHETNLIVYARELINKGK